MMLLFGGRKEFLLGKVTEKTSLVKLATLEPERSNEIINPKWHVKEDQGNIQFNLGFKSSF